MKPKLHFTPERNWMNDPNGLIYFQGQYHIFYQYFPYTCEWGTMHWGHAVSQDLVHFEYLPIALYPSKDYDRNGCFSGSAVEYNHKMYLYYTSIRYAKENPNFVHIQYSDDDLISSQSLVISEDGYTFDNKDHKYKVVDVIVDPQIGDIRHARDPKVWLGDNGNLYMIIGSKVLGNHKYNGEVLFYKSSDGLHFEYQNKFVDETIGDMWECPDLFKLDNQYYLIFSPEHINLPPEPNSNAVIMPVDFNEDTCTLTKLDNYMYLDYGLDFYAPQTFIDEYGNRIMFGWLRMRIPAKGENWCGLFTYPRILSTKDKHIYQNVHPHIEQLFTKEVKTINFNQPFKMQVSLKNNERINLGGLKLYIQDNCLYANRENVSIQHDQVCNITYTPPLDHFDLDIYYDQHIFEIYINNGYYVFSQIVYELNDEFECSATYTIKVEQDGH
ncbi:MAG: glycoside hydrolase family 32 protein [Erysipelotrichaceae bacterium]|nr:glycoside hydrolase family 32 protein [Erysipelotrichaceae bacterium]